MPAPWISPPKIGPALAGLAARALGRAEAGAGNDAADRREDEGERVAQRKRQSIDEDADRGEAHDARRRRR